MVLRWIDKEYLHEMHSWKWWVEWLLVIVLIPVSILLGLLMYLVARFYLWKDKLCPNNMDG